MFRTAWTIGRIRGIPLRLHISLLLVVPFLAMSVAGHQLPRALHQVGLSIEDLAVPPTVLGFALSVALFVGVLLHELGHALVALKQGGRVRGITLMVLGGVTEIENDDATPRQQAWMAFAGPLVSLGLGVGSLALASISGLGLDLSLMLAIFGWMNVGLAIFNLIPAYPLDGGRILRALLAMRLAPLRATRIAATVGRTIALAAVGFTIFFHFDPMLLLVAAFVYLGASVEEAALTQRDRLGGLKARQAMVTRVASVEPEMPLPAVARHMLFQGAAAALVRDAEGIYGVIVPADLRRGAEGAARGLCPAGPLFVHVEDDLGAVARELQRPGRRGAIVQDDFNIIVGVVTHDELARASALRHAAEASRPASPDTNRPVKAESYDRR
jgi:Zn-dependent protease